MSAHTVTVAVEPEVVGAKVIVGGQPVSGESITLTDHHGYASVAVSAPGYFPFRKLIELKGTETTVTVHLKPLPSKRRHAKPWILLAMVVFALVKMVLSCR